MTPGQIIHDRTAAFSLLEVLVASAVLSIVLTVLLGALTTSLGLWRNTESKLQVDREGRAATLMLVQDLSGTMLPANSNLWPRVSSDYLQFLTFKPSDYQRPGDKGDICFVEYHVNKQDGTLLRKFLGSKDTYDTILAPGKFPSPDKNGGLLLADNVLDRAPDAVRGNILEALMTTDNFVILNTNLTRLEGPYTADNRPAAVEVNVAATDLTSMDKENQALWRGNPSLPLRHAGIYSFRVNFPAPALP